MDIDPPSFSQQPSRPDGVLNGCFQGCLCQIGFFLLASLISVVLPEKVGLTLIFSWGITSWIALIPLIRQARAEQRSATATGLLLTGCIGALASTACSPMLFS